MPGHVHDDLVRHGVIEDPFYRMNERECQWVDQEDWVYRCRFSWSAAEGCPKRVLRFEGLDTVCSVFLNGDLVATHDNMFLPLEVDVTSLLRASNELVVEFSSAVRVAESRRAAYLAAEGIDASVTTFYERSFLRKAQYMFGWDWGPRLVSCGIWKPVVLIEYDSRVTDVWVQTHKTGRQEWEIEVAWQGTNADVAFECDELRGCNVDRDAMRAMAKLIDPPLWRPGWGYQTWGQILLPLNLRFGSVQRQVNAGFRTVELVREPDQWGESFEFVVNGEKTFCKGANWIPAHSYPSLHVDYGNYAREMIDAGFNMVRVWGGGLYESDEFYKQCDQAGIMVWQDFPFACAYYPEDGAFLASVEAEARANVRRLRNHPSLVLWCGNNENQQMHEQRWGGAASPARFYGEKIYDELLPRVLAEEDPNRPYVHGSPSGKIAGRDSNMDGVGDSHYWDVWHGRGDWKHYEESTSRFSSEFGFASSPSLYTWSKFLDRSSDWKVDSEAVRWHDKTLKGYEKYISFIEMHYPKVETLEDLVYYSQLNQRDAMRCALEHYRRSQFCAGTLIWQFNDCWPVQSWSLIDSSGIRKAAFEEVSRLYRTSCCWIELGGSSIAVDWINEVSGDLDVLNWFESDEVGAVQQRDLPARKLYGVMNGDGRRAEVPYIEHSQLASRNSVTRVLSADISGLDPSRHFFYCLDHLQNYPYVTAVRLLDEPKNMNLVAGGLTIGGIGTELPWIRSELPVIDLVIWDEENQYRQFGEWIPLLLPGVPGRVSYYEPREPKRLVARSLAGYHEVEITRSPLK